MKPTTVLGLDPGSTWLGWGLISIEDGDLSYIDSGVLVARAKDPINVRLQSLAKQLREHYWELKALHVAMEDGFVGRFAKAALGLGMARGVCIASVGPVVVGYTPAEVKRAVSRGNADKKQVAEAVKLILGIDKDFERDDESDALAVAIAHANQLMLDEMLTR